MEKKKGEEENERLSGHRISKAMRNNNGKYEETKGKRNKKSENKK